MGSRRFDHHESPRSGLRVVVRRLRRALDVITTTSGLIGVALIVVIVVIAIADITRRNLLDGRAIQFAVGLQEILLAAVAFALLPWAQMRREHVSVDLVIDRLPLRVRRMVELVTNAGLALVTAWLTYISLDLALAAHATHEAKPGVVSLPIWPVRYMLVAAWALLALQFVAATATVWAQLRHPESQPSDAEAPGPLPNPEHAAEDWS